MDSTVPPDELLLLEGKLVLYAAYLTVNERERGREREEGGGGEEYFFCHNTVKHSTLSFLFSTN